MWHLHHGKWWMIQWAFAGWVSLGIHIDFRRRFNTTQLEYFGPYVDLHLGPFILSFGYNCYFATHHADIQFGRGGVS